MGDITTCDGWFARLADDDWEANADKWPRPAVAVPCLVVTGDLDTAKRRLDAPDDAAIERTARAIHTFIGDGARWDEDRHGRPLCLAIARAALAAAEETPDA